MTPFAAMTSEPATEHSARGVGVVKRLSPVSCDIHTHTPAPQSSTSFILDPFDLQTCSTNYLGHGHGYECHSPPREAPPRPREDPTPEGDALLPAELLLLLQQRLRGRPAAGPAAPPGPLFSLRPALRSSTEERRGKLWRPVGRHRSVTLTK